VRIHTTGAALLIASIGTLVLLAAPTVAPDTAPQSSIVTGFALEFFLGTLAIAFAVLSGAGAFRRLGLQPSRISWRASVVLIGGTLALSFALNGIYELAGFGEHGALAQFESDLSGVGGATIAFAVISFALAPGFAEELLCRGLIQRGLASHFGPITSVGLAALFFGALHVEPIYAALATLLGAYLGTIALLGDSIRTSIVCHGSNNLVAVLTAVWGFKMNPSGPLAVVWVTAALVLAAGALRWAWREIGGPPVVMIAPENPTVGLQPESGSDDS